MSFQSALTLDAENESIQHTHFKHETWMKEKFERIITSTIDTAVHVFSSDVDEIVQSIGIEDDVIMQRSDAVKDRNLERLERFKYLWKKNLTRLYNLKRRRVANNEGQQKQQRNSGTASDMMMSMTKTDSSEKVIINQGNHDSDGGDSSFKDILPPVGFIDHCHPDPQLGLILDALKNKPPALQKKVQSKSKSNTKKLLESQKSEVRALLDSFKVSHGGIHRCSSTTQVITGDQTTTKSVISKNKNNSNDDDENQKLRFIDDDDDISDDDDDANGQQHQNADVMDVGDPMFDPNFSGSREHLRWEMIARRYETIQTALERGDTHVDSGAEATVANLVSFKLDLGNSASSTSSNGNANKKSGDNENESSDEDIDEYFERNVEFKASTNEIDDWLKKFHKKYIDVGGNKQIDDDELLIQHNQHAEDTSKPLRIMHVNGIAWDANKLPVFRDTPNSIDETVGLQTEKYKKLYRICASKVFSSGHCFVKLPGGDNVGESGSDNKNSKGVHDEELFARFDLTFPRLSQWVVK